MALSEYEKEVLAQMERGLKEEDPDLASVMTSSLSAASEPSGKLSPRRVAVGVIVAVIGLGVVVGGVSAPTIWATALLGIVGFSLMLWGVLWALKSDSGKKGSKSKSSRAKLDSDKANRPGFMQAQRDKWQERGKS